MVRGMFVELVKSPLRIINCISRFLFGDLFRICICPSWVTPIVATTIFWCQLPDHFLDKIMILICLLLHIVHMLNLEVFLLWVQILVPCLEMESLVIGLGRLKGIRVRCGVAVWILVLYGQLLVLLILLRIYQSIYFIYLPWKILQFSSTSWWMLPFPSVHTLCACMLWMCLKH